MAKEVWDDLEKCAVGSIIPRRPDRKVALRAARQAFHFLGKNLLTFFSSRAFYRSRLLLK